MRSTCTLIGLVAIGATISQVGQRLELPLWAMGAAALVAGGGAAGVPWWLAARKRRKLQRRKSSRQEGLQ